MTLPKWEDVHPGDYIEARGNVGAVDVNKDGTRTITVYPAELTRHERRPACEPVERQRVPRHVHHSGYVDICPLWFTPPPTATTGIYKIFSTASETVSA